MNEAQYLRSIGKSDAYFAVVRKNKTLIYRYMMLLGKGDLIKGHMKYHDLYTDLRNELVDICYKFGTERSFGDWLYMNGFHTCAASSYRFANIRIFKTGIVDIRTFKKMRRIKNKFKEME